MPTTPTQSQREENSDFGLPKAEFKPIRKGWSPAIIVLIIIILLAIIGGGGAYWLLSPSPKSELLKETSALQIEEEVTNEIEEENIAAFEIEPDETLPDGILKEEQVLNETSHPSYRRVVTQKATLTKIHSPQSQYHIIVNSFIDDDLAADYAKKLVKQGISVTILAPLKGDYFFRVAVAKADTLHAAHKKIEELKSVHGDKIWVKKY